MLDRNNIIRAVVEGSFDAILVTDRHGLVTMANDISNFFASDPDKDAAVDQVANHLKKFWEPRMRRQIVEHYRAGGTGPTDVAAAGVAQLSRSSTG